MYVSFLSGNFLTSTIILLIFIRGVNLREKGGKESKKRKRWGAHERERERERERESCNYVKSYQVSPTLF